MPWLCSLRARDTSRLGHRQTLGFAGRGFGYVGRHRRVDLGGFLDLEVFDPQLELFDRPGQPIRQLADCIRFSLVI